MRTQEQIVARVRSIKDEDFLRTRTESLISYLDFEHANEFINGVVDADSWKVRSCADDDVRQEIRDYLPFAQDKANEERGISAGRSLGYFADWIWLIGDEELFGDLLTYEDYGKDHLRAISDRYMEAPTDAAHATPVEVLASRRVASSIDLLRTAEKLKEIADTIIRKMRPTKKAAKAGQIAKSGMPPGECRLILKLAGDIVELHAEAVEQTLALGQIADGWAAQEENDD